MIANARMTPTDFKAAANAMNSVVERRNTIPILGEVLISISAGKVTFCSTNLDQQLTMDFEAETDGKASFTVSAQHLIGFAGAAQDYVQINLDGPNTDAMNPQNVVELRTTDITMRSLDRYDVADFPKMTRIENATWRKDASKFTASQDDLRRAMTLGRHCISTEETRYYLNGSYLTRKPDSDTLRVVTTDGHRMGVIDTAISMPEEPVILPAAGVDLMNRHMKSGGNEPIAVQYGENFMVFSKDSFEFATKLIDGTYPDYMRVIPAPSDKAEAQVSSVAVNRLASINNALRSGRSSPCVLDMSEGKMVIKSPEGHSASAPLTAKGNFKTGVNFKYLQDQAKATPTFTIQCASSNDPMRCFGADPDALFILMPMRV